jgi:hypothetical protein
MANEAHNGLARCVRTRLIGQRLVGAADALGVRHLAMEALRPDFAAQANEQRQVPPADGGYLAQPEMRALIQTALEHGWTLWAYEADVRHSPPELDRVDRRSLEFTNWRELEQARQLASIVEDLHGDRLLVWCGNAHAIKARLPGGSEMWVPMGFHFTELSGVEPFVIDQTLTVRFVAGQPWPYEPLIDEVRPVLEQFDGSAGVLRTDLPAECPLPPGVDAFILSIHNELT